MKIEKQLALIKQGNHKQIMAYINQEEFCERAEVALIERGNHEEIVTYIIAHDLYEKAQNALIKRGNAEEIEVWEKTYMALMEEKIPKKTRR